jgi:CDP-diacylglycerol--glycerol-3-phosphate 3-phosphatidyltransferase
MTANIVTGLRILLLIPLYLLLAGGAPELRWWALGLFLAAGLTDVLDGWLARRLNQASAFGALLDLVADRLLTLSVVAGLIAGGGLGPWAAGAGIMLIARDIVVSALTEALPGKLVIRVSPIERIKITLQIVGFALLIAPPVWRIGGLLGQHQAGGLCLVAGAVLAGVTLVDYVGRAVRAMRAG